MILLILLIGKSLEIHQDILPHYIRVGLLCDATLLFSCNSTEQLGRPLRIVWQHEAASVCWCEE
ncbi:hypothetical protein MA16_Dca014193 [Dendrobium catenatum]|uniref:Uncharacterized protein n=1 Tax=Dendrobium catenatum TaxID=906689 RepID=A0A2I0VTQ7_9ASPA|nr:hypothetical protein MA16_Dca014193 [Dendrobium catenatum]